VAAPVQEIPNLARAVTVQLLVMSTGADDPAFAGTLQPLFAPLRFPMDRAGVPSRAFWI